MHPHPMQFDDEHTPPMQPALRLASDESGVAESLPESGGWQVLLRGEVVTSQLVRADRMWSRMRGLLGRASLPANEGLWITPCPSIHMFGMRFAIDAVFLDEQHQVVRVFEDLLPWRMARGGKFAHSVLELPRGKAAFFNIRVGDRLEIGPAIARES